jgi:hypothetical protein
LLRSEKKQENTETNESKCRGKLATRTMVGIILIASMMGCVDQRMEGKRSESYQQKDRSGIE